jgi:hypothetical protein
MTDLKEGHRFRTVEHGEKSGALVLLGQLGMDL